MKLIIYRLVSLILPNLLTKASAITTRNQNDNMKAKKRYNTSSYYKAIYSDKTCRKGDIIFLIDSMTPTTYIVRNNSSYLNIETHGGYKLGEEIIHT